MLTAVFASTFEASSHARSRMSYNRLVGRRSAIRGAVIIASLMAASGDVIALQFSMAAMSCCAKMHHECAGVKTSDDCCQSMGRGVAATVSMAPDRGMIQFGLTLAIQPAATSTITESAERSAPDSPSFKRLHDPPHLHPVALLI
jgi:hypothetical protein